MPILFSAVAYDNSISAKYASCDGNFAEIAQEVLHKIPSRNEKMTYSHGHYLFHYIADNECFYFCITDKTCQRSRAFLFLNEIRRRFSPKTGEQFCEVLADEMYRYSEDYSTITIRKGELDELNSIGVGCSESILGEKLLMVHNPEDLRYTTVFRVDKTPQTPSVTNIEPELTTAKEIERDSDIQRAQEQESGSNELFFYVILVTVILALMAVTVCMPLSLIILGCVCFVSVKKLCGMMKNKKE